jgi:hypothetical protein
MSSTRSASVKPTIACFAPQYALCSGMDRKASALETWTITPRSRGFMRSRAARVPWTKPK